MLYPRTKGAMCIVDTCTLVYLNGVQLARKPLQEWLWEAFAVHYSKAVFDEFSRFKPQMQVHRDWGAPIWGSFDAEAYERALFSTHQRRLEGGPCKQCRQSTWHDDLFAPDLANTKDRGERHNCCAALDAVLTGQYAQVILLSDDLRAKRDYMDHFLETFPLGSFWSSLDLIIYLFVRYRQYIKPEEALNALRIISAYSVKQGTEQNKQPEKINQRFARYSQRIERIDQVLKQLPGGYQ